MKALHTTSTSEGEIIEETKKSLSAWGRYWQSIDWDHFFAKAIQISINFIILSVLFFIFYRVGKYAIHKSYTSFMNKQERPVARINTIRTLLDNIFVYTLFFFYLYSVLTLLGVPIGSLLAGAGIAGLAIGLGAQGFMNDIITGFFILLEQQLDVGDYVKLLNIHIEGYVLSVGIRTTKLQSKDGTIHFIPNRNITTISNLSRSNMRAVIDIRILPDENLERIHQLIEQVNTELTNTYQDVITQNPTIFGIVDLGNGNYVYRTVLYTKNDYQSQVQEAFLKASIESLTKDGITIPQNPITLPS